MVESTLCLSFASTTVPRMLLGGVSCTRLLLRATLVEQEPGNATLPDLAPPVLLSDTWSDSS